jgi:hypothetical protein
MNPDAARDAIEDLEDEIERLGVRRQRCRKISLLAKIAIAAGFAWLLLTLFGVVWFWPSLFFAAMASSIGGIVLLGSNATTWDETDAAVRKAEAARAALIGTIELQVVDAGVRRLH